MSAQPLLWKDYYDVTCPYCGHSWDETLYLNTEQCCCPKCEKDFYIEFQVKYINVVSYKGD